MERHGHGHSLFNAFHHLFRRGQTSSRGTSPEEQVDPVPQPSGALHPQFHSPEPIQLDQSREVTSFGSPAISHSTNEDVEMLFADPPSDMPSYTTYSTSDSSQLPSLPPTGAPATSSHDSHGGDLEALEATHPPVIDVDARSDTSMPPLYDASDSEYDGDSFRHHGYDSMSESDADAYDVEMTLLVDDNDASDDEDPVSESALPPSVPSVADNSHRNHRHVVIVEEVEDEGQQRTDTIPSASNGQPGSSSHFEAPPQSLPHHHPHPHPHPHLHFHRHQYPHPPRPQQPDAGVRLPNFPPMPGLRTQGQVEGQVPLPGLRTLFQPLIVEAIAQASERFRTAQAAGGSTTGQGPAMGPAAPIVQVTFDVPVFRVPTGAQTRQPQAEARSGVDSQGQTDQTFDDQRPFNVPPSRDGNPNAATFNVNPPTPNPIPTANDAMPPLLRQLFEAAFDAEDPQPGAAPPGWAGLMGLLFGLGLGASHDLNREDPVRARKLVKGLEAVSEGLVKRMRKISEGSADGAICAVCWDALLEEDMETTSDTGSVEHRWNATSDSGRSTNQETDATDTAEPEPEPEEPLPKVIALPCSHVFHSACLVPWFSRPKQTTCPTCRFNVDPENLTYEPPRRTQSETRQQQQQPTPPQPVAPQQEGQVQWEFVPGVVPPPQQAAQQQDGPPLHPPPLGRTIFEHTFTIPFPPPAFPLAHMQAENLPPRSQPEMPQQGPSQQDPLPVPPPATDPLSSMAFQRAFHNLRRQFVPHTQHRPPPPPNAATQEASTSAAPVPPQPQAQPPLSGQGLQPPPQDGQRNTNGMPRFPGLFQFELPQIVRMPDGTWFWSAPLGGFPTPPTAATPQPPSRPGAPKRTWVPPPPPGLTLRQRVEQSEREQGLRCDDMSCGVGPSDDDPEPTADLSRVVIRSLGVDGASGCEHTFHPACLVSAERVAGWAPDNEDERERAGGFVEVSCPICRAVGAVPRNDWENGVQALA